MPWAFTYLKCPDPGRKLTDLSVVPQTEDWVWPVRKLAIRKVYQRVVLKKKQP